MKAWKYGLALLLGLSVSGCGTQGFAQTATGLSGPVVPKHAVPMPEQEQPMAGEGQVALDTAVDLRQETGSMPERGIKTPEEVENLLQKGAYKQADQKLQKFLKKAQGGSYNPCDLIYMPMTVYSRMMWADTLRQDYHREKRDFYIAQYLETCGHTVEAYELQDAMANPRTPETTIEWMTKAIQAEPDYSMSYRTRGEALWQLQRTQEACADFKKCADLKDGFCLDFYTVRCQ